MGIFGNSPTTPPFPKNENAIRYPDNYPQKRTILVPILVNTITEVVYIFRFRLFIHILFSQVDTEIFVPLTFNL